MFIDILRGWRLCLQGRNVVLESKFGSPRIVNDGVTVAKEVELADPIENVGAKLVRQVRDACFGLALALAQPMHCRHIVHMYDLSYSPASGGHTHLLNIGPNKWTQSSACWCYCYRYLRLPHN